MKNDIVNIVEQVLIYNHISNYDKKDLDLQLKTHPNYPSFQSITDTLDYFDIQNIAVEVPKEALDQLPKSFISLVATENGAEIVAVHIKNKFVHLAHTSLKQKKYTLEAFQSIWIPKVIGLEEGLRSKFSFKQSILPYTLALIGLIGVIITVLDRSWNINQIIFGILSIFGVLLSFLAVKESLGMQSETLQKFCTTVSKTSCNDVINTASGKLFGKLNLADAGMLFFGSLLLHQLFFGFTNLLFIPVLIGIPVLLYSLYAQAFVIKKWCIICLAMGGVLIGLSSIAILNFDIKPKAMDLGNFILLSSIFSGAYVLAKQNLTKLITITSENIKLNQFKRDPEIFKYLLSTSKHIDDTTVIKNEIILGNPNADFKIACLTNPMCGFCKDAFLAYTKVIKTMGEKLQIILRINTNVDQIENQDTQISLALLEIYNSDGQEAFIKAYLDWFSDRNFDKWISKYRRSVDNKSKYIEVLKKQVDWKNRMGLNYTPASIINQTLYPQKYGYKEFFHFIGLLIENHSTE